MNKDEFDNEQEYFDDDLLSNINESLAKQITDEMEDASGDIESSEEPAGGGKNKMPKWLRILLIILAIFVVVGIGGAITINGILDRMRVNEFNSERNDEYFDEDDVDGDEMDPNDVEWLDPNISRNESGVINILLVGEEAIGSGDSRGRTDSIMIGTINIKQKSFKLTSLMRDLYVQIPGYSDNKINAAYHNGGIPLLVETINKNFGIKVDGSVLVNFEGFEKVIDKLGGVEITLTGSEARYLNSTNYISKKAYRNVREGTQVLNGNQALGYSRVRYVRSEDSGSDDFGRTGRQRKVLDAVFQKYKTKNTAELGLLLNDVLPYIQTDISKPDLLSYIFTICTLGATDLETMRIPVDNGYKPTIIRRMSVLLPDLPTNITALHEFIFGDVGDVSHLYKNNTVPATSNNSSTTGNSSNSSSSSGSSFNKPSSNTSNNSSSQSSNNSSSTGSSTSGNKPSKPVDNSNSGEVNSGTGDKENTNEKPPVETEESGGSQTEETEEPPVTETPETEEPPETETPETEPPATPPETEAPSTEIPSTEIPNTEESSTNLDSTSVGKADTGHTEELSDTYS